MTLLSPQEFKELTNVIVIDVRTPQEFSLGHIKDAILIDFYKEDFIEQLMKLDKKTSYAIYCNSGSRSAQTCQFLSSQGFLHLYDLEGGIFSWKEKKLPLVQCFYLTDTFKNQLIIRFYDEKSGCTRYWCWFLWSFSWSSS